MKVLAVLGSPHEEGYSSRIAREILRGAADAGHEVVVYEVNKMNIKGCQGCGACKGRSEVCVVQDDLASYWKELSECDALVVSSPNYCSQVTGPMITYMNRHYSLIDKEWKERLHPGIKLFGVFSQGNKDREMYRKYYDWYLGFFKDRGMDLTDTLIYTGYEPLEPDDEIMKRAYSDGHSL